MNCLDILWQFSMYFLIRTSGERSLIIENGKSSFSFVVLRRGEYKELVLQCLTLSCLVIWLHNARRSCCCCCSCSCSCSCFCYYVKVKSTPSLDLALGVWQYIPYAAHWRKSCSQQLEKLVVLKVHAIHNHFGAYYLGSCGTFTTVH